jgi:lipoprotein-releasing system ATP-binding protein
MIQQTMSCDLAVHELSKSYPSVGGELSILRGVELELNRGEALAVTGPSGSGKSTLLYILGLLDRPNAGTVSILGEFPFTFPPWKQAAFRNRHVGFVFQDHHLLPQCTVLENVLLPTIPAATSSSVVDQQRAKRLLERVGLAHRVDHRPAQLSGGERQRVAVCRALINQPTLLLADEPTGNLDRVTAETVGSLLLDLNLEQQTILICVTHSVELAQRFPRRMTLKDGRLADG